MTEKFSCSQKRKAYAYTHNDKSDETVKGIIKPDSQSLTTNVGVLFAPINLGLNALRKSVAVPSEW